MKKYVMGICIVISLSSCGERTFMSSEDKAIFNEWQKSIGHSKEYRIFRVQKVLEEIRDELRLMREKK